MNPELEKLLKALLARDNAAPADFPEAASEVERLLTPILDRLSPTGRADFLRALRDHYRAYVKAADYAAFSMSAPTINSKSPVRVLSPPAFAAKLS